MHYDKVKRDKIDFCNICGKYENLTWDHVPPKCCNNMYPIKVNSWWEGIPEDTNYEKNYQNGIRYRSLCSECNSKLGAKYDIVLDKKIDGFSKPKPPLYQPNPNEHPLELIILFPITLAHNALLTTFVPIAIPLFTLTSPQPIDIP